MGTPHKKMHRIFEGHDQIPYKIHYVNYYESLGFIIKSVNMD